MLIDSILSLCPQALGSMYFIHKTLENILQYDFNGKETGILTVNLNMLMSFGSIYFSDFQIFRFFRFSDFQVKSV